MKSVTPQIFLIGEPKIHWNDISNPLGEVKVGMQAYLNHVGAPEWRCTAGSDIEALPEIYGKLCYRSWKPGLNQNVTKVREDNHSYIKNILDVNHGSVLEHGMVNWIFADVSRVLTHELVRHRVGTAISQESLRFVRLDSIKAWAPTVISEDEKAMTIFTGAIEALEKLQTELSEHYDLDTEGIPFSKKKIITSAMRRIAPIGLATTIGWSCNFRTLRAVIESRTSRHAEEEIRLIFGQVAKFSKDRWPAIFQDMRIADVEGYPECTFGHSA